MRHKLVTLFKRAESLSSSILNHGISSSTTDAAASPQQSPQPTPPNDQLKLQRNIRYFVINYLRENSFNLAQLPSADEYALLAKQRQRFAMEEARRNELEQARQKQQLLMQTSVTNSNRIKYSKKRENVSIDNSNGWIPQGVKRGELLEDVVDGGGGEMAANGEMTNSDTEALRIQIQLVERYLEDAVKANKKEEAELLRANLNELLTTLANMN